MKGFGETEKPHTVYGWDEFVSPMLKYISGSFETIKRYVEEQKC
jgi:hypothetical protein